MTTKLHLDIETYSSVPDYAMWVPTNISKVSTLKFYF
jgi:hypothetical protein